MKLRKEPKQKQRLYEIPSKIANAQSSQESTEEHIIIEESVKRPKTGSLSKSPVAEHELKVTLADSSADAMEVKEPYKSRVFMLPGHFTKIRAVLERQGEAKSRLDIKARDKLKEPE